MGFRVALILLLALPGVSFAQQPPPLEAYGALPDVSSIAISPNGELIAYRRTSGDVDALIVIDIERMEVLGGIDVEDVKPRRAMFIDDDTLVLIASDTMRGFAYRASWEQSAAFIFDIRKNTLFRLLSQADDLHPAQTGLGRIVGRTPAGDRVLMPAFVYDTYADPRYSLYSARTDRQLQRVIAIGRTSTIDWFIDELAQPFIREDFDQQKDLHRIWRLGERDDVLLYEEEGEAPSIKPLGLTTDRRSLIVSAFSGSTDSRSFYSMSTETGEIGDRLFGREGRSIDSVILDINRVIYGVEYEGFYPTYEFYDARLTERMSEIQRTLARASVRLVGWSEDFEKLLVHASGGWTSGAFILFAEGEEQPKMLALERESIGPEHLAETIIDEYEARDGLTIPALVTAKPDVFEAGAAPLIVLPHGGPAAFDRAEFDWLAQFFASRGYVVLQPQFRGSSGFGLSHQAAGHGEWGRKMQTDLDDGVAWLAERGAVDSERVCIVGASYGGYAALAAGAFSPDLYRCHVSINGVADIRLMLIDRQRRYRDDHWVVSYWEGLYGTELEEQAELDTLSPARHAESFQRPVLLIHGRDDTVVPVDQSRRMSNALRREDKDVEFVEIPGEDHWLSNGETRIEVLRIVAEFVEQHL